METTVVEVDIVGPQPVARHKSGNVREKVAKILRPVRTNRGIPKAPKVKQTDWAGSVSAEIPIHRCDVDVTQAISSCVRDRKNLFLLGQEPYRIALGGVNEGVEMAINGFGRAALERDVLSDIHGFHHVDGVPRTDLGTVLATNATVEIDIAPGLKAGMIFAGHFVDTINRANFQTGLAPRATVGVDDREDLGDHLPRLARKRRCCHGIGSRGE